MSNKRRSKGCPHGVDTGECAICNLGDDPTKYGYAAGAAGRAGKIDPRKAPKKAARRSADEKHEDRVDKFIAEGTKQPGTLGRGHTADVYHAGTNRYYEAIIVRAYPDVEAITLSLQVPVIRLPIRTLTCIHARNEVCRHCVEGVAARVSINAALQQPRVQVLRLDAWRFSMDSHQRKAAGGQDLKTTSAEIQKQMIWHARYLCDGCVHCKELP